jgi:hypothetical protein
VNEETTKAYEQLMRLCGEHCAEAWATARRLGGHTPPACEFCGYPCYSSGAWRLEGHYFCCGRCVSAWREEQPVC